MRLLLACATVVSSVLLTSPVRADPEYDKCISDSDGTNAAWSQCGWEWLARADKALNEAWHALRGVLTGETWERLLEEQRAWNQYKEKACLFWASGEFGRDGQVVSFPLCRASVIEARTRELKDYLKQLSPE